MSDIHSRLRATLAIGLLGLLCLISTGCGKTTANTPAAAPEATIELAESDLFEVRAGDLAQTLRANGTLHAIHETLLRAKVSGEVMAVNVRAGERVEAGQVLARIDDREYAARADDRRAALEAGRAQAALAESTRSKNEELLQKNFLPGLTYDNAKSAAVVARSQVQSLEAQLTLAEKSLSDTTIRAPIGGWISQRTIQRGDKISPDSPLFGIVDLSRLELEALAPANEIGRIAIGQTFNARIEGYGVRPLTGHVSRIAPQASGGNRAVSIFIEFANPDTAIKSGLFAEGNLVVGHTAARALAPLTALRSEAGRDFVYLIEQGRIRRQTIELGMSSEAAGLAEIRQGLEPGARIVGINLGRLKEGATVRLVQTAATQRSDTTAGH